MPSLDWSSEVCRSEEHTSELQSHDNRVCRLLLEKTKSQRYLVNEQENHISRMHAVALGNAPITEPTTEVASNASADQNAPKPAATHHRERVPRTVHIK